MIVMSIGLSYNTNQLETEKQLRAKISIGSISFVGFLMILVIIAAFLQKNNLAGKYIQDRSSGDLFSFSDGEISIKRFLFFLIFSLIGIAFVLSECIWTLARKNVQFQPTIRTKSSSVKKSTNFTVFAKQVQSTFPSCASLNAEDAINKLQTILSSITNSSSGVGNVYSQLQAQLDQFAQYSCSTQPLSTLFNFANSNFSAQSGYNSLYAVMSTLKDASKSQVPIKITLSSLLIANSPNVNNIYGSLSYLFPQMTPDMILTNLQAFYNLIVQNGQMWLKDPSEQFYDPYAVMTSSFNSTGTASNVSNIQSLISSLSSVNISLLPSNMQIGVSQVSVSLDASHLLLPLNNLYNAYIAQQYLNSLISKLNTCVSDFKLPAITNNTDFNTNMNLILNGSLSNVTDAQVLQITSAIQNIFPADYSTQLNNTADRMTQLQSLMPQISTIFQMLNIQSDPLTISNNIGFFLFFVQQLQTQNSISTTGVIDFLNSYTTAVAQGFLFPNTSFNQMPSEIFVNSNFDFNFILADPYVSALKSQNSNIVKTNASEILNIQAISDSFASFISSMSNFFILAFNGTIVIPGSYNCYQNTNVSSLPNTISTKYLSQFLQQRDLILGYIKSNITKNGSVDINTAISNDLNLNNPNLQTNLKQYFAYMFAILQCNAFCDSIHALASISSNSYNLFNNNGSFDSISFSNLLYGSL